jgi:hypothetical protein
VALGDLSTFSMRNRTPWVARIVGELAPEASAEDIVGRTPFTMPEVRPRRPGRGIFDWIRRGLSRLRPARRRPRRAALTAVMSVVHDVQVFGTETGIEAIGVPFPHLVFLVGTASAEFRSAIAERIAELLRRDWNDLIDPLIELRVRMLIGQDTGQREIVGYFGRGIFAPRPNERPIGRIEIVTSEGRSVDQPMLPGEIPAGLYRGQGALVFSGMEQITPAVSQLLPANCRFLLRGSGQFDSGSSPLCLECEVASEDPSVFRPLITSVEPPPPGYDAVFRVEPGDGTGLDIKVIEDDRPSRLLDGPPADRFYFAIVGVVAPEEREDLVIRRWWVDLDRDRRLLASAMRPRSLSIVCEDGEIEGYDWFTSGRKTAVQARLTEIRISNGTRSVLRMDAGAFGYLRAPPRTLTIGFDDSWATSTPGAIGNDARYQLDWLDFAGAAETPSLYAERLATCAAKEATGPLQVPGLDGRPLQNPGFRVRRPDSQTFEAFWNGTWEDGTELMVGPLVLKIVDREDQA